MVYENAIYILSTIVLIAFLYYCIKPYFYYFERFFLGESPQKSPLCENSKHLYLEGLVEKELNKLKEMSFEQREHYLRLHTRQVKKLNGRETIIEIIKEHNRIKVRAFPKTPFGQLFETSKKLTLN